MYHTANTIRLQDGSLFNFRRRVKKQATTLLSALTGVIDDTVFFISSRNDLTAKEALSIIRVHWKIENNLHWQKDHTYAITNFRMSTSLHHRFLALAVVV